jgi:hypothetical protein
MGDAFELELRVRAARAERERDAALAKYLNLSRLLAERTLALEEARGQIAKLKGEPTARFKQAGKRRR